MSDRVILTDDELLELLHVARRGLHGLPLHTILVGPGVKLLDVLEEYRACRGALRSLLDCPPPGRRLGKQQTMQARFLAAALDASACLPGGSRE